MKKTEYEGLTFDDLSLLPDKINVSPTEVGDALTSDPVNQCDIALTNPPFGKKSNMTIFNVEAKLLTVESQPGKGSVFTVALAMEFNKESKNR